ncbi:MULTISPECIES: pentapeptide repeat-containing protein [Streptomyces]|uniref:pentapeptide repeat-containing protein n=1 Tax=Streptomyces TaxID=1883 RepID=UPI001F406E13|nr:pentapeptide repeat-containing protein [Streptomyces olivochromogenes]MCF3136831.1 pentapeptide repeat-containing protein [Streptomyces olivochromogenes]
MTALVALLFTWMSVDQSRTELRIAEQGQITNRFTAAINNLGSNSEDVRLGGIYALQRIMLDSARDQPTIVTVLTAYARRHAPVPASGFAKEQQEEIGQSLESPVKPAADVQAVLSVMADRSADHGERTSLDLRHTDLRGAEVFGRGETLKRSAAFRAADFNGADLRRSMFDGVDLRNAGFYQSNLAAARFDYVDLSDASMEGVDLTRTTIWHANLTRADLNYAKLHEAQLDSAVNLTKATLVTADLTGAYLDDANLRNAALIGANLRGASLTHANLHGARLSNVDQEALADEFGWYIDKNGNLAKADLTGADLTNADLRGVDLTEATLVDADLRGAKLAGVKLARAKLDGVRGLPPSLRP